MLGTSIVAVPSIQAKTTAAAVTTDPQIRIQIGRNNRRYYNRRRRVVTTTRIRRVGPWTFRETIRTVYLPNGTARTKVVNRRRLNRWRNY
jgi:hypothetical protein